jgi:threonine synthase
MDPHTAVGFAVYEKWMQSETVNKAPTVILSTASPYKFSRTVLAALGLAAGADEFSDMEMLSRETGTPIPAPLAAVACREVVHTAICNVPDMPAYVFQKTEEKEWMR